MKRFRPDSRCFPNSKVLGLGRAARAMFQHMTEGKDNWDQM